MQLRNLLTTVIGGSLMFLSAASGAWTVTSDFDDEPGGSRCSLIWNNDNDIKVSTEKSSSGDNSCRMGIDKGSYKIGGGVKFPSKIRD